MVVECAMSIQNSNFYVFLLVLQLFLPVNMVLLLVPEGAVEEKAIIWIEVTFVSNKFKFEDDFVPVSLVVWAYTNCQLAKPAKLYIPHHIDASNMYGSPESCFSCP